MNKQRHSKWDIVVRVLSVLVTFHLSLIISPAQTFTQQVQQTRAGQGKVTIHQDATIDALVNDMVNSTRKATAAMPARQADKTTAAPKTTPSSTARQAEGVNKNENEPTARTESRQEQTAPKQENRQETRSERPAETRSDTTSLAAQRRMKKVTGYRIQAFVGANRQKAEQTGNALRTLFPDQPVYVHFLQPRWICRMGNFRTYADAKEKLNEVRQMGYEAAIIVKGKISVPDN